MNTSEAKNWENNRQTAIPNDPYKKESIKILKVTKNKTLTKGEKYLYSLFSLVIILASVYMVSYSSKTDTMNRELQSRQQVLEQQEFVNEGLKFEVKELSQPERITKIAKNKGLKIQAADVKKAVIVNE